jgi:predicted CXXCH cytochrome family protein
MVHNEACAECHGGITQHAATDTDLGATLAGRRCATCHKEHAGPVAIVRRDSAFCADCHNSLKSTLGDKTELQDVRNFARQHPEFRPVFLRPPADPGVTRWTSIRLALDDPNTREQSNLRFTHKAHLDPAGVDSPDGKIQMNCGSCHEPDVSGATMLPVEMKRHCSSCHTLGFESVSLPHASVEQVINVLRGYYLGPRTAAPIPVMEDVMIAKRRQARRPGAVPDEPDVALTPEGRVQRAARDIFERTLCVDCHTVDRAETDGAEPGWKIERVRVNQRWMPSAHFNHKSHAQRPCDECHKAEVSEQSEDVLIPGIRMCRECHAGNAVTAGLRSPCIECHDFHLPGQPKLIPAKKRAMRGVAHGKS